MKILNYSFYLFTLLLISSCHHSGAPENALTSKPNIILIMADDLGYEGIGCYDNKILKTPHLDEMAENGVLFTDFHANGSVCTPTRAALLTGRYQQRVGLEGVIYARGETRQVGLDTMEYTLAKALKTAGYATGIMGKWHLGYRKAFNPIYYGFDEFYGYVSGNVDFHTHFDNSGVYDWWHNLDTIQEKGYVTDLITEHSINFIKKNKDRPFFLYVPHEAPHVPFQGRNDPGYRYADNEFTYYGPVKDRDRAYIEMVEVMDEGIGKIIQTLEALNLEENTLVVFISDNGGESFGHNGVLNGDKGSLLEGGHRVPAIAQWKGKIQKGISQETVMSFDWMPTFMALANVNLPDNLVIDGIDLSDHLFHKDTLPQRNLFWKYRKEKVIRQNQYKLLINEKEHFLYDLDKDLSEQNNIADSYPELMEQLKEKLVAWERKISSYEQKTK